MSGASFRLAAAQREGMLVITEASKEAAKQELWRFLGVGVKAHLDDPLVQEVMINSGDAIFVERSGVVTLTDLKISTEAIEGAIIALANVNQDRASYIFDGDLPGLRFAAARPPIAVNGACMSIRKHGAVVRSVDTYRDSGAFAPRMNVQRQRSTRPSPERVAKGGQGVVDLFKWMLTERKNFIVSGGTSSGKTTFLNMLLKLLAELDPARRLLTFEDTRELVVPLQNSVSFLTKDVASVSARKLVRLGMRFKPDCIWFGEARGEEAYDLLKAYGTGHPGSGFSLHADSSRGALTRLERLIRESDEGRSLAAADLRSDIANTFSILIHCERVGKVRALMEIVELQGVADGQYLTTTLFKKELDYV